MRRELLPLPVYLLAGLLAAFSVAVVDGPAATLVHQHVTDPRVFIALTHLVDPVPPAACLGLVGVGGAMALGWRPPRPVRTGLAICIAALLAIALKDQLKFAFGRTWPETWVNNNPSWIRDGVMGFTPFHGGPGWSSFPSGHTTMATAPMAVLILVGRSAWRWLSLLPVALVAVGLLGADYHFVGDMIAGAMVGWLCAAATVAAIGPHRDPA